MDRVLPFHQDRTPSFTIWRAQGKHWQAHCFGCGWHGDVLDLVCQAYGLSLPDAARRLAASDMPDRLDQRPHLSTEINISHQHAARSIWEKPIPFKERLRRPILANAALRPLGRSTCVLTICATGGRAIALPDRRDTRLARNPRGRATHLPGP
jgi:hypothetical protein